MRKFIKLKNQKGVSLIELLVALLIVTILIFAFAPFFAACFGNIVRAGELNVTITQDKTYLETLIAERQFLYNSSFPVKFQGWTEAENVEGTLLEGNIFSTYTSFSNYYSDDAGIIYEGYLSDDGKPFGNKTIQGIGLDMKLFKNHHTIVEIYDKNNNPVDVNSPNFDYEAIILNHNYANLVILAGTYGLNNEYSPYKVIFYTVYGVGNPWKQKEIEIELRVEMPLYLSVGGGTFENVSTNGSVWVEKSGRLNSGSAFNDIIWNEDRYLAVNNLGEIYYMMDGEGWNKVPLSGTSNNLNKIRYIDNEYIVVGSNGTIVSSADGINWTYSYAGFNENLTGIAYNGTMYVITCQSGKLLYSQNKTNWSEVVVEDFIEAKGILWANPYFIAVGGNGNIVYSSDGVNWNIHGIYSNSYNQLNAIEVRGNTLVVVGQYGQIHKADISNILSWTTVREANLFLNTLNDVKWGRRAFIAVGNNNTILYSTNGVIWSTALVPDEPKINLLSVSGRD